MKAILSFVLIVGVIATIRGTFEQFNRFLDPFPLRQATVVIERSGVYYQPFPVHYLEGFVADDMAKVRVEVLPEVADAAKPGEKVDVVIGRGLLRKRWIAPADKHAEYSALSFKIPYLCLFGGAIVAFTWIYFRRTGSVALRKRLAIYAAFMILPLATFYVV